MYSVSQKILSPPPLTCTNIYFFRRLKNFSDIIYFVFKSTPFLMIAIILQVSVKHIANLQREIVHGQQLRNLSQ